MTCTSCRRRPPREGRKLCAQCAGYQRKYQRKRFGVYGANSNWRTIVKAYGAKCACCGETELFFLTIDHVNNDGAAHRKELGLQGVYEDIIARGFPPEFQVLCRNCNWGKRVNEGVCPHVAYTTQDLSSAYIEEALRP